MGQRVSDEAIIAAYEQFGHLGQAAASVGIHKSSLHERLVKLGVSTVRAKAWGPDDDDRLRADYMRYRMAGRARELAESLDRTVGAVTTRAYSLGLTDPAAREASLPVSSQEYYRRSAEDRYRAAGLLTGLGAMDHDVRVLVVDGDPMSKARARFARRGATYTPASVRAAEGRLAGFLEGIRFDGNVAVGCVFVRAGAQRIDVDNMLKLVLDACTQADVWDDDSQVTALAGLVELDPYEPRTIIALAPHESTMKRGTDHWPRCATCGDPFNPAGRRRAVFCSQACRRSRPVEQEAMPL